MEGGEEKAQNAYQQIFSIIPEAREIFQDEKMHEHLLIDMIDEKRLNYISSMIQGLNDARTSLLPLQKFLFLLRARAPVNCMLF
jgi:hypothetical protein